MEKQQKIKRPGRFPLSGLLAALFLAFTLTSGLLGFQLGKNANRSSGGLIDTIVLSPGDSPLRASQAQAQNTLHFLFGRLYREAAPCASVTVRLGDGSRSDVTDEQGRFYMSDVRSGEYTLEVVDAEDSVLASTELVLDFSAASVSGDFSGGPVTLHMPEDTRTLELSFTMDESGSLTVEEAGACFVTKDGQVVNFDGSALKVTEDSHIVTPAANLVATKGYILLPSESLVLSPRGEQREVVPDEEAVPGAVLEEDGSVLLEEDVVLLPNGEIQLPGGEIVGGGDKVVIVTDETVEEVDPLPEEYTPPVQAEPTVQPSAEPGTEPTPESSAPSEPEQTEEPTASPEPVSSAGPEEPGQQAGPPDEQPAAGPEPTPSPTPSPTPEPTPTPSPSPQGLVVTDEAGRGRGVSWKQQSTVDLFKNRTDNMNLGEKKGVPLAAPGSTGYYEFRLENPEDFDIAYTISVEENTFHLPIRYSLIDTADNEHYLYRERIGAVDVVSPEILIPAHSVQNFRIDWEWSYEDWFYYERDDATDLNAAKAKDRLYVVSVSLNAVQITNSPDPDRDGDTRYPGKR